MVLDDMNQIEMFELCENSATLQCPDCNAFFQISGSFIAVVGEI